jgi:type II secretory pathway component PulC
MRTPLVVLAISLAAFSADALAAEPVITQTPPKDGIIAAGQISKAQLTQTVSKGAQQFIAGLQVRPVMEGKRFRGFELTGIRPQSPLAGSVHIRPGDVIISVNGAPVERPDQFMKLWDALPTAKQDDVKLRRAGHALVYRWTITP